MTEQDVLTCMHKISRELMHLHNDAQGNSLAGDAILKADIALCDSIAAHKARGVSQ